MRAPGQRCREWRHESVAASRRVSAPRDERTRSLEKSRNYSRVVTSSPPTPHPVTSLTENGCDVAGQVVAGKQLIDGEEEEGEEEGIMRKKGSRRGERRSLTIYSERASRSWLLLIVMMVVMKMMLLRTAVSSQRHWVTEHVHVHDLPRKERSTVTMKYSVASRSPQKMSWSCTFSHRERPISVLDYYYRRIKGPLWGFQAQIFNMCNINEVITQADTDLVLKWIKKLLSEENKVPRSPSEAQKGWQGPPHVNKVKQSCPLRSVCVFSRGKKKST